MPSNTPPQTKTLLNLAAVGAATPSQWMSMEGYVACSYTIRVVCSAAFTAAGSLVIRGTNHAPQDVGCPAVITFTAVDAPAAGGGFTTTALGTTGVLSVNPTGAGTFSASFNSFAVPKFLQAEWLTGATGGGTVSIQVDMAGW